MVIHKAIICQPLVRLLIKSLGNILDDFLLYFLRNHSCYAAKLIFWILSRKVIAPRSELL